MNKDPIVEIKQASHTDGLENLIANLGTDRDKRNASRFNNKRRLSRAEEGGAGELSDMYRTDWLSGKVVDIIPDDMSREWRSFTSEDMTPEMIEEFEKEERRLQVSHKFNRAGKWARLYGTSFIILAVDDGRELYQPLNLNAIGKGDLRHITVIDRHRVSSNEVQPINDPMDPAFGMPKWYRLNGTKTALIHYSRMLRFDGVELPYDELQRNGYWSDSVLDRLYESILNFATVTDGTASMVYNQNVDVVSIKGLMDYLQSAEGEKQVKRRFALASLLKSFNNLLLLDSEEEFNKVSQTFSGLPELMDRYAKILAAATDIPATRLLGMSASGLNATGEGDLKNYYDKISSLQEFDWRPKLDYLDAIMARSLGWSDDSNLSYEFNPLFQQTPEQIAQVQLADANRDQIYINNGVVSEVTVAQQLRENGVYTNISDDWISYLQEVENDDRLNEPDPDFTGGETSGTAGTPGEEKSVETSPDQGAEVS